MKLVKIAILSFGLAGAAYAQPDTIYNPNSTEKIPYYEQLYRFRVWRTVDLGEKQNAGFKSAQSDLTNFLIKGIQSGAIVAYDDSLKNIRPAEEILVSNQAVAEIAYDPTSLISQMKQFLIEGRITSLPATITKGIYQRIINGGNSQLLRQSILTRIILWRYKS